jgi:hypothetical protein
MFCAYGMSAKHGLIMYSRRLLMHTKGQEFYLLLEASYILKIVHFMQNLYYGHNNNLNYWQPITSIQPASMNT